MTQNVFVRQKETAFGEKMYLNIYHKQMMRRAEYHQTGIFETKIQNLKKSRIQAKEKSEMLSWRVLRNRVVLYPDRPVPRDHPITFSMGGVERRENIYNVKLGIAADHSPQTNPGYSRTPSGAFYSI